MPLRSDRWLTRPVSDALVHDAGWGERFLSALTASTGVSEWPSWPKVTEKMALTKKQRVDNIAHIEETLLRHFSQGI